MHTQYKIHSRLRLTAFATLLLFTNFSTLASEIPLGASDSVKGPDDQSVISEGWINTALTPSGNNWIGSDSGRGIAWVSETAAGNPNAFPVVIVLSNTSGALQVLNATNGNFVNSGSIGSTGDSTLGTYRLDAFEDGVIVTNGFQGTVRIASDINGTNARNLELSGGAPPSSDSRAVSAAGNYSKGTGIIGLGRANTVEIYKQDSPSSDSFTLSQTLEFADDIDSRETVIDSTVDGIGISRNQFVIIVANSSNQDDVALYKLRDGQFEFIRTLGVFTSYARQDVDTDGTIVVATESSGFFGDSFGVGLLGQHRNFDLFLPIDPTVSTNGRGYNAGDSVDLDAPNLAATITLGRDGRAYGYSANSAVFQLKLPNRVFDNRWMIR